MSLKGFLYGWCGKKKVGPPIYDIQAKEHGAGFTCSLKIPGFDYEANCDAASKKDAASAAAEDFCNYLIGLGQLQQSELPGANGAAPAPAPPPLAGSGFQPSGFPAVAPMVHPYAAPAQSFGYQQGYPPQQQQYFPQSRPHRKDDAYLKQVAADAAQAELVDIRSEIHGGWGMENSKAALNMFLQKGKLPPAQYVTNRQDGGGVSNSITTLNLYIPQARKTLTARGQGSNKKVSEASCAMSMVRQLFHMGFIEKYVQLKKTTATNLKAIPVDIPGDLEKRITDFICMAGIQPTEVDPAKASSEEPISLLTNVKLDSFPTATEETSSCMTVYWEPPRPQWSAWSGPILDPPYSMMTMQDISRQLYDEECGKVIAPDIRECRNNLPVFKYRDEVINTIKTNSITIIKGDTGCGKSTQVVQFLLEAYLAEGRGSDFTAVVSQPRRISAISLADRVAYERGEMVGNSVGYGVRFDSVTPRPYGSIFYCTVAVLLRKMADGLRGVSHVIIDEIHERSLETDFALIVLRDMIKEYPDLRVVLMSATIETAMFTDYFAEFDCPVIEMEGRTFEVQHFFLEDVLEKLHYMPPPLEKKKDEDIVDEEGRSSNLNELETDNQQLKLAMSRISENMLPVPLILTLVEDIIANSEEGAILIFLPGWNEIQLVMKAFTEHSELSNENKYKVLPLHGYLPAEEQRRVFSHYGPGVRKIILSTNIAETSVTIDDVVFVVDSGKMREIMYTVSSNMVHYATTWCSKHSVIQRRGRAGRVRPGFAFHLCSKKRFEAMSDQSTAEILRVPLYSVVLLIKLLRLGSISEFLSKAPEQPSYDMIVESVTILQHLGALDAKHELTPLGYILARLPIDPDMGKMIVMGTALGIGSLSVLLAAASSFPTPFVPRYGMSTKKLDYEQLYFAGSRLSDHVALVAVNQAFAEIREEPPYVQDTFCQRYSLNRPSLRNTLGATSQIIDILTKSCGFPAEALNPLRIYPRGQDRNLDLMISLLIPAVYPNVGYHHDKRQVFTLEQSKALLAKMSVMVSKAPKFDVSLPSPLVVFKEKVRTYCISCKELSVVSAVQLLLFGSRKVECTGEDSVRLDDMIPLTMKPHLAAAIVALRPYLDSMIVRACMNPASVQQLSDLDTQFIDLLCDLSSADLHSAPTTQDALLTNLAQECLNGRGGARGRGRGFGPREGGYGSRGRGYAQQQQPRGGYGSGFGSSYGRGGYGGGYAPPAVAAAVGVGGFPHSGGPSHAQVTYSGAFSGSGGDSDQWNTGSKYYQQQQAPVGVGGGPMMGRGRGQWHGSHPYRGAGDYNRGGYGY